MVRSPSSSLKSSSELPSLSLSPASLSTSIDCAPATGGLLCWEVPGVEWLTGGTWAAASDDDAEVLVALFFAACALSWRQSAFLRVFSSAFFPASHLEIFSFSSHMGVMVSSRILPEKNAFIAFHASDGRIRSRPSLKTCSSSHFSWSGCIVNFVAM